MRKPFTRIGAILLACSLLLPAVSNQTAAKGVTNGGSPVQLAELPLAKLYGDLNPSSSGPTSVIVELTAESIVEAKHKGKSQSKSGLKAERDRVIRSLEKAVPGTTINREYDYVFSGFSVELPAEDLLALAAIPGVKAVYPNLHYMPDVLSGEEIPAELFSPAMASSAPFIGSNVAWESGYTGKGVTVAVIDTGVDYTHPDLDQAFGSYKGWDFVDNDHDPQEGAGQYHGTHVAGTVAANGTIKGVAPEAKLLAYRVLGPNGGRTEDVVASVERAVLDGADVMNLSLGNSLNNPDWATSIALDWAMAEGVVAVTSTGNTGPNNWTVGSPGTSRTAISVGATQLPYNVYRASTSTSDGTVYSSSAVQGYPSDSELLALNGQDFRMVDVGFGAPADFEGKDLTGAIALISRGAGIPFVDKAAEAKKAGAVGAIIYNNATGSMPTVAGMAVPTIMLSQAEGLTLLEKVKAETGLTVSFKIEFDRNVGETIADFSSRGPVTFTWMIKPDVAAPGVNIVSTYPGNGYAALQGTSMASPHVAGAAALLVQKHPDWGTENVKAALMNTAVDLVNPATGSLYPHNSQGAGSIRIVDALNTRTLITPGSYSFGKFTKGSGKQVEKQKFTIKNLSSQRKSYSFEVAFAGNPDGIKVSTSKNLQVQPGSSQEVNFNVQVDAGRLVPGYYEGTIRVSDGRDTMTVPTILFVGEPDYPRVTGAYMQKAAAGGYTVGAYLPGGAEVLRYDLYALNGSSMGGFVGMLGAFTDASAPFHEFKWDGTVEGVGDVPKGSWVLGVYVVQAGVTEYKAYTVTKE